VNGAGINGQFESTGRGCNRALPILQCGVKAGLGDAVDAPVDQQRKEEASSHLVVGQVPAGGIDLRTNRSVPKHCNVCGWVGGGGARERERERRERSERERERVARER
jgi:hypothetical protein